MMSDLKHGGDVTKGIRDRFFARILAGETTWKVECDE